MPINYSFQSGHRLEILEDRISHPEGALQEMAGVLLGALEERAPVGEFNGGTLKKILLRVRGPFNVPGGKGIGVGDATKIVPGHVAAPKGTIKEFLQSRGELGKNRPPDKSWAWYYLSQEQKRALDEGRRQGKWGGMVGMAPYFWIQEYGKAAARVKPILFLEESLQEMRAQIPAILKRFIHAR